MKKEGMWTKTSLSKELCRVNLSLEGWPLPGGKASRPLNHGLADGWPKPVGGLVCEQSEARRVKSFV